jgi:uncharacterized protein (DUF2249 family)/hemerythrin-like domain-containing protein
MSDHPAAANRTVEADALPHGDRESTLLAVLDSLPPGESFVLSCREAPGSLLTMLRTKRRGQFDWTPLESGQAGFRIEVSRRSAGRGAVRQISEALGWDHERLARLEVAAFVARAAGEAKTAEKWYAAFSSGLKHHIAVEEEFLFPVFEKRLGLSPSAGPTEVMRREHAEILRLLGEISRTIGKPPRLPDEARAAFHELLEKHHLKEEEILYPALDYALSPAESDSLVAKIQEFAT